MTGRREADGNEQVLAFVETATGQPPDPDALRAHLEAHLAPYKRPARVVTVEAFPMTLSGKILKRALVEAAGQGD